jgi:hypothetical protein
LLLFDTRITLVPETSCIFIALSHHNRSNHPRSFLKEFRGIYFPGHPGFNLPQTFPKDFPCTYTGAQVDSAFMRWKAFANKNEITERKRPSGLGKHIPSRTQDCIHFSYISGIWTRIYRIIHMDFFSLSISFPWRTPSYENDAFYTSTFCAGTTPVGELAYPCEFSGVFQCLTLPGFHTIIDFGLCDRTYSQTINLNSGDLNICTRIG